MTSSDRRHSPTRARTRVLVAGALAGALLCVLAVVAWPTRDDAPDHVEPSARSVPEAGPRTADVSGIGLEGSRVPLTETDPAVPSPPAAPQGDAGDTTREQRYAGLDARALMSKALELGDVRGERMMQLAEDRFRDGRYQTIGVLGPGEKTIQRGSDSPLVVERVLPTGEYQVVEFSEAEYPDLHESKREQDWLFAEVNRRRPR